MIAPRISVIMPVYNSEKYVSFAIKSILNQTYRNFEFIIVNDGSTDNSEKIILLYKDQRIIYRKKEHTGISDTLNFGLKIARGEWIARMDSDDISFPNRLEKQMNYIQRNCDISVISTIYAIFKSEKRINKIKYIVLNPEKDEAIKKKLLLSNSLHHSSVMFKKNIILDSGCYDSRYDDVEDYELWLRISDRVIFGTIQEILLLARFNRHSFYRRHNKRLKDMNLILLLNYLYKTNLQGEDFLKYYLLINYYYGDKYTLRKILKYDSNVTKSIWSFFLYITTFFPNRIFDIKFDRWLEWRLNSFRTFFNKDKILLRKILKEFK